MSTEAAILSHVMDKSRQLTNIFLDLIKDVDPYRVFESGGSKLNSVFWIMAHLAVTKNFLLLRCTGGELVKIPWARQFGLGSVPSAKEDCPPIEEVKGFLSDVHRKSVLHIASLNDSYLDEVNATGFEFAGEKSVRSIIIHAIRHENLHGGHLSWLCKLHGIKTL